MNATHQDVIDYIQNYYCSTTHDYELCDGKIIIKRWIEFNMYTLSTLPCGLVFNDWCDLDDSGIESLPDDIVLYRNLYLSRTKIRTLPVLYVGGTMNISETNLVISDGTYIEYELYSDDTIYGHLSRVDINGYFFSTGILS